MGDIWLWFVFAGVPFDVRGGSSFFFFFFLRAVLSLGRPPSQHTWFSHPRICAFVCQPITQRWTFFPLMGCESEYAGALSRRLHAFT